MRYLLTCFLSLLLLVACKPKQPTIVITPDVKKNHLQRNHLLGQVKSLETTIILLNSADNAPDSVPLTEHVSATSIQLYSADGFLTNVIKLNETGDTVSIRSFSYYPDARQKAWNEYDENGRLLYVGTYYYDRYDFLCGESVSRHDSTLFSIDYRTDASGNIIEMQQHYDTYSLRNVMSYNSNGLVQRIDEYDPSGKIFKYATIEYDNYGDEVNRRVFKSANNLVEYTYTQYEANGALKKIIYEDRLNNTKEVYEYTEHDKQGNWLCEIRKKNNTILYIRKRTINYY